MKHVVVIFNLCVFTAVCRAQIVSVRCCAEDADYQRVAQCMSGVYEVVLPPDCPPAAKCVLGFGKNHAAMAALCDPLEPVTPPPRRAQCTSWQDDATVVLAECVAKADPSVNLWSIYDDEGDGDLDLADLAVFQFVYDVTPKLAQSQAMLVYAECCVPESVVRNIGACLSGPEAVDIPPMCDTATNCIFGFSEPVELGDWQNKLCAGGTAELPDPSTAYCTFWEHSELPPTFTCRGAQLPGHSLFIIADDDGDADVDLSDFAAFQRDFGTTNKS